MAKKKSAPTAHDQAPAETQMSGDMRHINIHNIVEDGTNHRVVPNADAQAALVMSIRKVGLLQPLMVRPRPEYDAHGEGAPYYVVAGHRRLAALKEIYASEDFFANVVVLPEGVDAATAALAENKVRLGIDPFEEAGAFVRLLKDGQSHADIAATFSVTPLYVRQQSQLANLLPELVAVWRSGHIRWSEAVRMAALPHAVQTKMVNEIPKKLEAGHSIGWMLFDAVSTEKVPMSHALFDTTLYTGGLIEDLFSDEGPLATDHAQFMQLQRAFLTDRLDEFKKMGWASAVIVDKAEPWSAKVESRSYPTLGDALQAKPARKKGSRMCVLLHSSGTVSFFSEVPVAEKNSKASVADVDDDADEAPVVEAPATPKAVRAWMANERNEMWKKAVGTQGYIGLLRLVAYAIATGALSLNGRGDRDRQKMAHRACEEVLPNAGSSFASEYPALAKALLLYDMSPESEQAADLSAELVRVALGNVFAETDTGGFNDAARDIALATNDNLSSAFHDALPQFAGAGYFSAMTADALKDHLTRAGKTAFNGKKAELVAACVKVSEERRWLPSELSTINVFMAETKAFIPDTDTEPTVVDYNEPDVGEAHADGQDNRAPSAEAA